MQKLFDTFDLIHNNWISVTIKFTEVGDGRFAVVKIDTLWKHKEMMKRIIGKEEFVKSLQ